MKKHILFFALIFCGVLYFISCSKKDETPPPSATCTDGTQNQGETGIDCGGPCTPCPAAPSCTDGIQNQNETDVDCGGPCPACPSCADGIQNQGETGIDCGGPCPACNLCNNGILDAGEIQIDCGGTCPPCPVPVMTCVVDSISWTASNPNIVNGGGNYTLTGENASLDTVITIVLGQAPQTGSIPLGSSNSYLQIGANTLPGFSGNLVITIWDQVKHLVSGTFEFDTGSNNIINGTFEDVYYQ